MKSKYLFVLKVVAMFVLIFFCFGISGNAATSSYNINIQYKAEKAVITEDFKADKKMLDATIYVAEFIDTRQVDDKKIIGWVKVYGEKAPLFPKNDMPTRIVANGIKEYLKKAGYKVADSIVQWDLKEGTMPKGKGKVIIGGSIDELEITCWTGVFSNDYKANLKFVIVVSDLAKGKILYKGNVESASSKTDVSFSEEQLGTEASNALGAAIEKVFEGKTVAQKIKETLIQ